ncbi:STAS/SEC14 domain-containing protein [Pedobacter yulinensis]|uniref:STAS/SEC14 domain-containing protein n=1 Tax=Pedobacter yulinensis TaxID=2126353 RepID=A0A2T3HM56_9SPHI|nr:STAS/SEC14 domain-containing protein [Pedobacter yulinensis]PST83520.1 STAS/SEC14 domain-containing protein [Pedobacter yulinensis]
MLKPIENLPSHVVGVRASGEVTETDLKEVLLPALDALVQSQDEIYYLLVLDTTVQNFTAGAWIQDMVAGLRHFTKWKKMAIVTPQESVETFTNYFSYISPGEARGFKKDELDQAIAWVSTKNEK